MAENPYSIVPLEILSDERLNSWHIRVLIGLLSFRSKNTNTVWPGRELLAERCRMHITNISKTTSELVEFGWLIKIGAGGKSRSVHYQIIVPDFEKTEEDSQQKLSTTVADLTTVAESATQSKKPDIRVADSATQTDQTVAESATLIVADSATRIEETIEDTNKSNRPRKEDARARARLGELGLPDDLAETWLAIRLEKGVALTEPDIEDILGESVKARLSFEQAIRICCEHRWANFKSKWYFGELNKPKTSLQEKTSPRPVVDLVENRKRIRQAVEQLKAKQQRDAAHPTG